MQHSGGETEAAGEGSLSGAHGEGSQGRGSRSPAGAAGSALAGAATGSTDKGEMQGSAKEKPQDMWFRALTVQLVLSSNASL